MKAHSTTRFCFCASNLTSTLVLATVFATLRTLAIFLVWYQIRPDINQTESKFYTVFENHRKKSHSALRAKRATYTFWLDKKLIKNAQNGPFWRVFEKAEAFGQTVLPDRSFLIGQKLPQSKISNATFWVTLTSVLKLESWNFAFVASEVIEVNKSYHMDHKKVELIAH